MDKEILKIVNFLHENNAKIVATCYDGSDIAYKYKNLLEAYILGKGIDVVDCDICALNVLSASIKKLDVDFGINVLENEFFVLNKHGEIIQINGEKEYKLNSWKDVGEKETRDVNLIYMREIFKMFSLKSIDKHLILNLNFSPLFKIAPYIFRKIFRRITTLNATNIETIDYDPVITTKSMIKAYEADVGIIFDKYGFGLKIFEKDNEISSEEILEKVIKSLKNNVLRDAQIEHISFDKKLNSIKYTKFSSVNDSILTSLLYLLQE